jgi:hypothetical protein
VDHENSTQIARHEGTLRFEREFRGAHHIVNPFLHGQRAWGQHHRATRAHEDRISEPLPDLCERVAHRRGRKTEPPRRFAHTAFAEESVERN